jgi:hypothetical protein
VLRSPRRCLSNGHFLIRFGKDSRDYAGIMGGLKEPVSVELASLRAKALPNVHNKFSFVQEVRPHSSAAAGPRRWSPQATVGELETRGCVQQINCRRLGPTVGRGEGARPCVH